MTRYRTVASVTWGALLVTFGAAGEVLPAPTPLDPRVRSAVYDPRQIYRLHAQVGYQIELELEPGETLLGQGAGDLDGIVIESFENHVFLKPRAPDVRTNLTLATNRRHYRFEYVVAAFSPKSEIEGAIYVVRFMYPDEVSATERVEQALQEAGVQRPRNFDYWYCGDVAIQPIAASDDGVHTRLTFDARAELPAVFVRNDDGSESLLNFSIDAGDVVIHRVARNFIVRRGRLVGCILNQGFEGSGERLESGTVTPGVVRERKEALP
jgi:type IV secretion system protein VirB9